MAVPYSSIQHTLDTSTSDSENTNESDREDVEDIFPYMFEPETDNSDSSSDEDDMALERDGDGRLKNLDWCHCGHRVVMPTARECKCCTEIPQVQNRMEEEGADCITTHPGFHGVCLDVWSLRTAYYGYRQQYGVNAREGNLPE
ncbi:hypothetical protein HOLleu_43145 [Holothuria leucospilota]|uniref:Uncharacterized protein n=1 Tax=Holothuria leucospilota TaxID=206669 RepID=A0A9Q0Y9R7_HOLLE|nr:hypothetical protein HOLleu_43145 [Holothuria leucospilota]